MSESRVLRERLEAAQERLKQVEASGDDQALLRFAMELNEKRAQVAKAKQEREELEAQLRTHLLQFRRLQVQKLEADAQSTNRRPGVLPAELALTALATMVGGALGVMLTPPLAVAVPLGGVLTLATFWWARQRAITNKAVDDASRLL